MTAKDQKVNLQINRMIQKTVGGLINDPKTGDQKEQGLKEGREIFRLAVAIKVILIRGFAGNSDGQKSHHGSHEIEAGMGRFSKDAQAAGGKANDDLKNGQATAAMTELKAADFFSWMPS